MTTELIPRRDLEWVQGDDNDLLVVVTDPADPDPITGLPQPVDLTGGKVWLYGKRSASDADADAPLKLDSAGNGIEVTGPMQGECQIHIDPTRLAGVVAPTWLYYSVQARAIVGGNPKVWEVLTGVAYVRPGIVGATA